MKEITLNIVDHVINVIFSMKYAESFQANGYAVSVAISINKKTFREYENMKIWKEEMAAAIKQL